MRANVLSLIFLLLTIFYAVPSMAQLSDPLLVLDKNSDTYLPAKFRTSSDAIVDKKINTVGFANLHIAGSAQFMRADLSPILLKLQTGQMTVVDLRNESHGFLNNDAISWYGRHNATNAGKTPAQVKQIESDLLHDLSLKKEVDVYTILQKSKDGVIQKAKPQTYQVQTVANEEKVVTQQKLSYQRFYVEDYHAPSREEAERFVKFVKSLPNDEWVYFHCRGGSGRSTEFMAMFDMIRNAKEVSFDDILARQAAIGGKDLRKLPLEGSYKYQYALQRLNFLKEFYDYVRNS